MRSFENIEVLRQFINGLLGIYNEIMITIFKIILILCMISYIVFLVINTEPNTKIKASLSNFKQHFRQWQESIKIRFTREKVIEISKKRFLYVKSYLWKCRYLVVGYVLVWLARFFVTLGFWLIGNNENLGISILNFNESHLCNDAELYLLGVRSLYSLLFFTIAPMFITFSFGNKFVRNIGVFIYILGIAFMFLGFFLNLGCFML